MCRYCRYIIHIHIHIYIYINVYIYIYTISISYPSLQLVDENVGLKLEVTKNCRERAPKKNKKLLVVQVRYTAQGPSYI